METTSSIIHTAQWKCNGKTTQCRWAWLLVLIVFRMICIMHFLIVLLSLGLSLVVAILSHQHQNDEPLSIYVCFACETCISKNHIMHHLKSHRHCIYTLVSLWATVLIMYIIHMKPFMPQSYRWCFSVVLQSMATSFWLEEAGLHLFKDTGMWRGDGKGTSSKDDKGNANEYLVYHRYVS